MSLTLADIDTIVGRKADRSKADALFAGLDAYPAAELSPPHRLAQFLPQVLQESGGLRYVAELWGPTKAQIGYEGRADLGNTEPGDGSKFRGYGLIQNTGRSNATAFRDWCWARELPAPDFAVSPEKQAEAPWAGLVAVWFWDSRGLNRFADDGNIEWITRRINGGLNGYASRLTWGWKSSLVLLGFKPTVAEVRKFQAATPGLVVDGDVGPATRAALHAALKALPGAPVALSDASRLTAIEARMAAVEARLAAA